MCRHFSLNLQVLAAVEAAEKALKIRQRFLRKFLFHGKREKVDDDGSDEDQYRTSHWDYFPRIRRSGKISKAVSLPSTLFLSKAFFPK